MQTAKSSGTKVTGLINTSHHMISCSHVRRCCASVLLSSHNLWLPLSELSEYWSCSNWAAPEILLQQPLGVPRTKSLGSPLLRWSGMQSDRGQHLCRYTSTSRKGETKFTFISSKLKAAQLIILSRIFLFSCGYTDNYKKSPSHSL